MLDWMEGVSNRWADKWMKGNDTNLLFRGFFVRPDELMDRPYLLRWVTWIAAFSVTLPVFTGIVVLIIGVLTIPPTNRRFHLPVPSFKTQFLGVLHAEYHMLPWTGLMLLLSALFMLSQIVIRAYFWNRRVRRLQANPPAPPAPVPGVWPPPPQIID